MTPEEIRNNAPKGATHYRVRENGKIMYYIFERGELSMMRRNNKFILSAFNIDACEINPLK